MKDDLRVIRSEYAIKNKAAQCLLLPCYAFCRLLLTYVFPRKFKRLLLSSFCMMIYFYRKMIQLIIGQEFVAQSLPAFPRAAYSVLTNKSITKKIDVVLLALESIEHFSKQAAVSKEIIQKQPIKLKMPTVFPVSFQEKIHATDYEMIAPSVKIFSLKEVYIAGMCDFLFKEKHALHHGHYQFDRDFTPEEMHGLIKIKDNKKHHTKNLFLYLKTDIQDTLLIEKGIFLISSISGNYIHWLTEIAPKLALIDAMPQYCTYPLIVDAGLHTNMLQCIDQLNTAKRPLIFLERYTFARIRNLMVISPVAYVPFEYRSVFFSKNSRIEPDHAFYVPAALKQLRQNILRLLPVTPVSSKRILIRRTSLARQIYNRIPLEEALFAQDFQVVEPEKLTFLEQVSLFSSAKVIVAQAGASLGNIIFSPPGSEVVILSAWSPCSNYYYFSNLAHLLGLKCTYVMSECHMQDDVSAAHQSFSVDITQLIEVIHKVTQRADPVFYNTVESI